MVIELIRQRQRSGQWIAAICAAPAVVLLANGFFRRPYTGYPSTKGNFNKWSSADVCCDQNAHLIASQGPGTVFDFALNMVGVLVSQEKAQEVAKSLLLSGEKRYLWQS